MLLLLQTIVHEQPVPGAAREVDERLIARIAQGDTQALASLYEATKSAVYGFSLSILRNPANAEDVMQETYIKLYQAAGSYQPQGKPMAWILTIARNLSLMKIRATKGRTVSLEEAAPPAPVASFEQSSLDNLVLYAALDCLNDDERQVVMLHSLSGLKHREIAEVMGMPLSTVLSKYNRALKKLRKILGEGEGTR